jgi:hypothetical protein
MLVSELDFKPSWMRILKYTLRNMFVPFKICITKNIALNNGGVTKSSVTKIAIYQIRASMKFQ